MHRSATLFALVTLSALATHPGHAAAGPAPTARAEVLVLGVYHMANPGRDLFNARADDVLAPRRQAEIAEVIEVLKRFRPNRIAIEADPGSARIRRYAGYLAGTDTLTANETDQIGFRLAKALGHPAVYAVDADGDFPWQRVVNYAKGSGRSAELDSILSEIGAMVKEQDAYLASHTVLETLRYLNADARVRRDMGYYYRQAHLGEAGDWAGADLVSDWFRRNMRIMSNVNGIIATPGERILVLYGSGHLGWLRSAVAADPTLRLRTLEELVSSR